jgi:TolB-like protein
VSADRWEQVEELFAAALEHSAEQRAPYLAATVVDPEARSEALSLLFAHEAGGRFDGIVAQLCGVNPSAESGPVTNLLDRLLVAELGRLRAALAGRYTIEHELGRGGMATVYLAQDERHHRPVAIKVLRPEIATGLGRERFLREIGIAARLNHPHILALLDSGDANGMLYYVMPFVEGESLRNRLTREQQLPLDVALQIAREVADALSYAHSHGVIHRDIKPENILLSSGHALVADFGIARAITAAGCARLTETGLALGTPAYMSPEQAAGSDDVDGRSDLYALGCVLYEMLSGEPPYTGPTPLSILAKKRGEPLPQISVVREGVPAGVESALNKALARAPADRWATAAELAAALAHPEAVRTPSVGSDPTKARPALGTVRGRGRPLAIFAGVLAVVAGVAYVGQRLARGTGGAASGSVAVLTFSTIGADTGAAYLAEGLADGITTSLSAVSRLSVISRAAVRRLADSSRATPAHLGEALGAANLVAGSIQRNGTRLRVTVELVQSLTGKEIWTARYDTTTANVLTVQSLVAEAVAGAVAGRLLPTERSGVARYPTNNPEAYDHYLRGNRLLLNEKEASILGAMAQYEAALRLDSTFTSAMGRLAYTYGETLNWGYRVGGLSFDSVLAAGLAVANRATAADSSNSDAWLGKGLVLAVRGSGSDLAAGADALDRATKLDASNDAARAWYGGALRRLGRFAEAEQEDYRAIAINPNRIQGVDDLGFIALSQRSYASAVQLYERALKIDSMVVSTHEFLALTRIGANDAPGAVREGRIALSLATASERTRILAMLANAEAHAGDPTAARKHFDDGLRELSGGTSVLPARIRVRDAYGFALAAVALGHRDVALTIVERAEPRGPWLWSYLIFEGFDPIRAEPRFRRVIDEARPPGAKDPG